MVTSNTHAPTLTENSTTQTHAHILHDVNEISGHGNELIFTPWGQFATSRGSRSTSMPILTQPTPFWPYFYTEGRSEDVSSIFRSVYRSYGLNVKAFLLNINMSKARGIKQHNQSDDVFQRGLSLCGLWRFFLVRLELTSGFHESHWWFSFPCISVYVPLNQSLVQVSNPQNHKFFFHFCNVFLAFWKCTPVILLLTQVQLVSVSPGTCNILDSFLSGGCV